MKEFYDVLKENFFYNKEKDITVSTYLGGTPEWTSIGTLTNQAKTGEIWMFGISMAWNYDTTNKSAHLRYTLDGGGTWYQSQEEPKDKLDTRHISYNFPVVFDSDTPIDFRVEATKQSDDHILTIEFCDLVLERKG